jgi:hypothetical protein
LVAAANEQLHGIKVPACESAVKTLPPKTDGRFDWEPWLIELNDATFNKPELDDAKKSEVANTVYHEARHAEQLFNIARLMAGQTKKKKMTAAEIAAATKIKMDVVNAAMKDPIAAKDPEAAKADANKESIFGAKSAERDAIHAQVKEKTAALLKAEEDYNAVMERCKPFDEDMTLPQHVADEMMKEKRKALADQLTAKREYSAATRVYKQLPEEADAFAVGDQVGELVSALLAAAKIE